MKLENRLISSMNENYLSRFFLPILSNDISSISKNLLSQNLGYNEPEITNPKIIWLQFKKIYDFFHIQTKTHNAMMNLKIKKNLFIYKTLTHTIFHQIVFYKILICLS